MIKFLTAKIELLEKTIKNGMLGSIISSLMISKHNFFFTCIESKLQGAGTSAKHSQMLSPNNNKSSGAFMLSKSMIHVFTYIK